MRVFVLLLLTWFTVSAAAAPGGSISVASKNFNESYILAEIMSQLLESRGFKVDRHFGLGGTLVCYKALQNGEVDIYPEYTGTLGQAILKIDDLAPTVSHLNQLLAPDDLMVLPSFGFNDTYAIAMKTSLANKLDIHSIADLSGRNNLKIAFSLEFLNRKDGWPGLAQTYGLTQVPTGIEHGLAYQAIDQGKIDVTDAYSTDAGLARYHLTTLTDDRHYFPEYLAVPFIRSDVPARAQAVLSLLKDRIDAGQMRQLNAAVSIDHKTFAEVAKTFLTTEGLVGGSSRANAGADRSRFWRTLGANTLRHLELTAVALLLGCLVGLPLGILVYRSPGVARVTVYLAGLLQTIPSIALLALMIPLFGIGVLPAIVALFLYSILPILRNTITALITIDPLLKRIAEAIGLTRAQQLRYVLIPMAMPNMLAGIKTAAIISIGTATLAAFIGAGGLGQPIVTGLALNDTNLILQGAIPAACLAILVELAFEMLERLIVKPHMRAAELPG